LEYALVSEEEAEELLGRGRGEEARGRWERRVHEQIEEEAKRRPEAVAVEYEGKRLSYGELNEEAERLAGYLEEAGVGEEGRVGIYLRRSLEMLIGVLGVMKAGGVYVPLDPGLPRERLEYMMEDAGIEWVLAESGMMEGLPLGGVDVVVMDGAGSDAEWLAGEGEGRRRRGEKKEVKAGNLAYIMYTSGSTGRPKGVMVTHGGLANYVGHGVARYLGGGIVGGVVSLPLSFDAVLTTLLGPLVAGKRVEMLEEGEGMLKRLAERLFGEGDEDEGKEEGEGNEGKEGEGWLFKVTPAHLEALEYVERGVGVGRRRHRVVVGGEQLLAERLRRWKGELLPRASFVNEYGPTEAVVGCSVWEIGEEEGVEVLAEKVAVPIGRAIGNTELYVLGEGQQLQPVNSVGELYIGGAGLARGYLKEEGQTRERFVVSPFAGAGEGGKRLYRTGDLVRWLPGGELEFVGRRDEQVKVRGYRIELGEIEGALLKYGGIKRAVVMVREDEPGEKRLVAYYVAGEGEGEGGGGRVDGAGLRSYLAGKVPEYMIPGAFVQMKALPLTGNGKVDRRALPAWRSGEEQSGRIWVGPRTAIERALCEVWEEVLKLKEVGVQDNFFSLGGDSILAIRVVARLRSRGIGLNVKDLFQYQTVEQLAVAASQTEAKSETSFSNRQIAQITIDKKDGIKEDTVEITL